MYSSGERERVNQTGWDFDPESSVTMIRPSKSKEIEAVENHTLNHMINGNSTAESAEEQEEVMPEAQPQLSINDTAFVDGNKGSGSRNSVVSTGDRRSSMEGSSGIVVVRNPVST